MPDRILGSTLPIRTVQYATREAGMFPAGFSYFVTPPPEELVAALTGCWDAYTGDDEAFSACESGAVDLRVDPIETPISVELSPGGDPMAACYGLTPDEDATLRQQPVTCEADDRGFTMAPTKPADAAPGSLLDLCYQAESANSWSYRLPDGVPIPPDWPCPAGNG